MGTRSQIAYRDEDGIHSVYCHWDGYIEGVGALLLAHYNSIEDAMALVSLGNISSLDESIEKPVGHSFDNKEDGYTVFYGRDRGEKDQEAKHFPGYDGKGDWLKHVWNSGGEYAYIWEYDDWYVIQMHGEKLTPELVAEKTDV